MPFTEKIDFFVRKCSHVLYFVLRYIQNNFNKITGYMLEWYIGDNLICWYLSSVQTFSGVWIGGDVLCGKGIILSDVIIIMILLLMLILSIKHSD